MRFRAVIYSSRSSGTCVAQLIDSLHATYQNQCDIDVSSHRSSLNSVAIYCISVVAIPHTPARHKQWTRNYFIPLTIEDAIRRSGIGMLNTAHIMLRRVASFSAVAIHPRFSANLSRTTQSCNARAIPRRLPSSTVSGVSRDVSASAAGRSHSCASSSFVESLYSSILVRGSARVRR